MAANDQFPQQLPPDRVGGLPLPMELEPWWKQKEYLTMTPEFRRNPAQIEGILFRKRHQFHGLVRTYAGKHIGLVTFARIIRA